MKQFKKQSEIYFKKNNNSAGKYLKKNKNVEELRK